MSASDLTAELQQLETYASVPELSEPIGIIHHNASGGFFAPVLTTCRIITEHLLADAWREQDLTVKSSAINQYLSHRASGDILTSARRRHVETVQRYGNPASHRSSDSWDATEARVTLAALLALLEWRFPSAATESPACVGSAELVGSDPISKGLRALQDRADGLLSRLGAAIQEPAHAPDDVSIARERRGKLLRLIEFLQDRRHRIAFVGDMGVGKSSTIAVLSRLFLGNRPTRDEEMRERSILTVGSGGTTVCEVCIRSAREGDPGQLGLKLDPLSREEMEQELRYFAEDEGDRRAREQPTGVERATSRELQRALRTMTGMREKRSSVMVGGKKKRRKEDPLDELFSTLSGPEEVGERLIELAKLDRRTEDAWWWEEPTPEALTELRARLEEVNHGRCPTAMLPQRITIVVPNPLPGLSYDLELIDSRGLDGALGGRPDLQVLLRDERTILVICAPFKKAPGEEVRNLLKAIEEDAEAAATQHRVLLALMDQGNAAGVNGAEGDREEGQGIKADECLADLQSKGIRQCASEDLIVAFDTFLDPIEQLANAIQERIVATREFMLEWLRTHVEDAEVFLERLESKVAQSARAEVDRRLRELTSEVQRHRQGVPLENPLAGLLAATESRHPSQVFASCRRNGYYSGMDAYGAVRSGAASAMTQWLGAGHTRVLSVFEQLEKDPGLQQAADHVRLRRELYERGHTEAIRDYASAVREEIETLLAKDDEAWGRCTQEWGEGNGFRDRVIEHHEEWGLDHSDLHAHQVVPPLDIDLGHEPSD